ncbi:MAG: acyl-CoA-binding protein [Candidatus Thalassarchaeaceae archaeon]|jgi:acyl-CoA-binding protein|nr:acyl-CoA-binding protein [Candidatus Thalassarchaeaceae archaeon]|tara:strand:+ start:476 stop:742 length:267 start_codon:yes stop_codon:yes gene_type:complete
MSLQRRFDRAIKKVWRLNTRPDDDILLNLYALYKQATEGDAGRRAQRRGIKEIAKFRAWKRIRGMTSNEAMISYCDLVKLLSTDKAAS